MRQLFVSLFCSAALLVGCDQATPPAAESSPQPAAADQSLDQPEKTVKSKEELKANLTDQQCFVLFEKGTERPFSNEFKNAKDGDVFVCAACELPLFEAKSKFESGTGWPSFYQPAKSANVKEAVDTSHGMTRTEITCARCGGHLGHLFNDGPAPTGLRYCTNGLAMKLVPKTEAKAE